MFIISSKQEKKNPLFSKSKDSFFYYFTANDMRDPLYANELPFEDE